MAAIRRPALESDRVPAPHQQEIDALCRYMDVERGLSPATIATARHSLGKFFKHIRTRQLSNLRIADVERLRASELIGVRLNDLKLQPQPSVLVHAKGRRERCLPLWKMTTSALRAWLAARGTVPVPELFVSARGESLTRSGFEYILRKHVRTRSRIALR